MAGKNWLRELRPSWSPEPGELVQVRFLGRCELVMLYGPANRAVVRKYLEDRPRRLVFRVPFNWLRPLPA